MTVFDGSEDVVSFVDTLEMVGVVMDLDDSVPAGCHEKAVLETIADVADLFRVLSVGVQDHTCEGVQRLYLSGYTPKENSAMTAIQLQSYDISLDKVFKSSSDDSFFG